MMFEIYVRHGIVWLDALPIKRLLMDVMEYDMSNF